jgi:hypothetical protein
VLDVVEHGLKQLAGGAVSSAACGHELDIAGFDWRDELGTR